MYTKHIIKRKQREDNGGRIHFADSQYGEIDRRGQKIVEYEVMVSAVTVYRLMRLV